MENRLLKFTVATMTVESWIVKIDIYYYVENGDRLFDGAEFFVNVKCWFTSFRDSLESDSKS